MTRAKNLIILCSAENKSGDCTEIATEFSDDFGYCEEHYDELLGRYDPDDHPSPQDVYGAAELGMRPIEIWKEL